MATVKYLFDYIHRSNQAFNKIKSDKGYSLIRLWIDSVWCFMRYGCTIRQYSVGKFYRYSGFLRKDMMTTRKFFHLVETANDKNYVKYLENKLLFNDFFKPFVKRKWYDSKTITLEEFKDLCQNGGAIVKPLEGTEGSGICKYVLSGGGRIRGCI